MDESIAEHIERNRREESGYRKPMGGSVRRGSRHWRTKSSSTRSGQSSTKSGKEDFLGYSYGFRPGRSQHDALDALWVGMVRKRVNWLLDLDIRSFFDKIQHSWLIQFVEYRIGDRRVVRLIQKWLKAGVMEQGQWHEAEEGSPQGAVITPLTQKVISGD
jgi:hypothetical protein